MVASHTKHPLVSFVVPTYNYGRFIRQCIDRCLEQEVDQEVIVVDACSTDDTVAILKSYGDRIRWTSEPDRGQADAVNKGVAMARGEIIAWINSDDYYPADQPLRHVAQAFATDPRTDLVIGDGEFVKADGTAYRRFSPPGNPTARELLVRPASCLFQPAVFFRRALFEEVDGLDLSLHYSLDLDLWLRMLPRARRTVRLPRVLAVQTIHGLAKTRSGIWNSISETERVKARYRREVPLNRLERLRLHYSRVKDYAYWLAVTSNIYRVPG